MLRKLQQIENNGYAAYCEGKQIGHCPWPSDIELRHRWLKGWYAARTAGEPIASAPRNVARINTTIKSGEDEYLIYLQDTCIGSVYASNIEEVWEKVKEPYCLNKSCTVYIAKRNSRKD